MNTPNPVPPPSPPSQIPNRKVTLGLVAGAAMTILAYVIKAAGGTEIPAEVALAGQTVLVFLIQYFVPNAEV